MFSFAGGRTKCMGEEDGGEGALGYLYRWRERERGEETKGEARRDEKEGDGEKRIRAGITLGDCGIVNPCRIALVLLLFLSPALSFPPSSLPPTLSVAFVAPFRSSHPSISFPSSGLAYYSSTYPSHGLVRRWNIVEQRIDGCWEG